MKVLLCEKSLEGHRKRYLECIIKNSRSGYDFFVYAPDNPGVSEDKYFRYSNGNVREVKEYFIWVRYIREIVSANDIDIVHILDGDSIMRYFGIGLHGNRASSLFTYHHFFRGKVRSISYRTMLCGKNACVVHTPGIRNLLKSYAGDAVYECTYPVFDYNIIEKMDVDSCKKSYGLDYNKPVFGIIGGLSTYKNIQNVLGALANCKEDFQVLICGRIIDVSKETIETLVEPYKEHVVMNIKKLTDQEYLQALVACDIICCIYTSDFDGASGPLCDGVCARKMILGCKHGSIHDVVINNHLGYTAQWDNLDDIEQAIDKAISQYRYFYYDEIAEKYRAQLLPEEFVQNYYRIYNAVAKKKTSVGSEKRNRIG